LNLLRVGACVALSVSATACDFVYGVSRTAPIYNDPTPQCVERVLRSVPEIATVSHRQSKGSRPITWSGLHDADVVETFLYSGPNHVAGVLQYNKDFKGRLSFEQSNIDINRVPPQDEITATRPVMKRIETLLENQCGLVDMSSQVREWCRKVKCPPIS
jgi:hypothetical protein